MLEKKLFPLYCDSHFHIVQWKKNLPDEVFPEIPGGYFGCTCAHEKDEFAAQEEIVSAACRNPAVRIVKAFGMHPQLPLVQNASFLEALLRSDRCGAVGETGFDLFTQSFRDNSAAQNEAWRIQLSLAVLYGKPVVIHCRKALELVFRDAAALRKIPAVLFHSFCGGMHEAQGILGKGINAYFSFGKQILNNNRKSLECTARLPSCRLLLETDSPFQTLKGEHFTRLSDICRIYSSAYEIRRNAGADDGTEEDFAVQLCNNFRALFGI